MNQNRICRNSYPFSTNSPNCRKQLCDQSTHRSLKSDHGATLRHTTLRHTAESNSGNTIAFWVVNWSNPYYLGLTIQFQKKNNNGGGADVVSVDLKDASSSGPDESSEWKPMQQTWGGVWNLVSRSALRAPYLMRLRLIYSGRTLVADHVIPVGWQGGATYRALVNHL
ncbi:Expansin-B4 [Camellia lanceoleosa]|uniref:Expansin-B4 n=1 Tax=Camellia lanceoleosa TaxID=1840588 RepID=A0ACC0J063_9ERIC|nr:Expansin-B4 [Camellia lanceoleosa]